MNQLTGQSNLPAGPGAGAGSPLYVTAANAGAADLTPALRVRFTAGEHTRWGSERAVVCRVSAGINALFDSRAGGRVVLTSGGEVGTTTQLFSYDVAAFRAAAPSNALTRRAGAGAQPQHAVLGLNFGAADASPRARFLPSAAASTRWASDSGVSCGVVLGVFASHLVHMTAGLEHSTGRAAMSHDAPRVARETNLTAWNRTILGWTGRNGSYLLLNLSAGCPPLGVRNCSSYSLWNASANATAAANALLCLNFTACLAARSLCASVLVYCQNSSIRSYPIPLLGPSPGPNSPTFARPTVTLAGSSLGSDDYTAVLKDGKTACESTAWISDSALGSTWTSGVDWQIPAVVTVGQQRGSLSQLFTFDAPSPLLGLPSAMTPRAAGPAADRIATVLGGQFSAWDTTASVWIGGTLCAPSFWTSDSSLSVGAARGGALRGRGLFATGPGGRDSAAAGACPLS